MMGPGEACRKHGTLDRMHRVLQVVYNTPLPRLVMDRVCVLGTQQESRACVFTVNGVNALKQIPGSVDHSKKKKKQRIVNKKKVVYMSSFGTGLTSL